MVGVIYLDQDYDQIGAANINGVLFWLTITNIINPYTNALGVKIEDELFLLKT